MRQVILDAPEGSLIVPALETGTDDIWFSLVIPTYNERQNLEPLLVEVTRTLNTDYSGRYEVIIVDDNSPDGTAKTALQLADKYNQLRVMLRKNEKGLATAVIRGWQKARGSILGVMDGDLQHPAPVLLDLLRAIKDESQLALASRYVEQGGIGHWGRIRRTLSAGAKWLGAVILPEAINRVHDPLSGFFVLKREAIAGIALSPQGYKILLEVLVRGHIQHIAELPFQFGLRQLGQTKVTWLQYWQYILHLLALRYFLWQYARKEKNS
jgi:dolichol-phosphate mannosyltransferase